MCSETLEWLNFFKEVDMKTLENKINEVETEANPLIEKSRPLQDANVNAPAMGGPAPGKKSVILEEED